MRIIFENKINDIIDVNKTTQAFVLSRTPKLTHGDLFILRKKQEVPAEYCFMESIWSSFLHGKVKLLL